ncbi:hypothetical protein ElyMa_005286700 [Elysia marginata]|uniref:Uncharacterized protein n=1 Tax=Elysia marginata TaxID=1093978 RepID=A0AAV4K351_9GAST|nr:hypothetical protein ElyMa_005286700 [Elysia marginata]
MFPRIENHYTRKSSKRMYPDPSLSIAKIYQLFIEYCQENNLEPASERTYRKIFCEEFNLSFFKPKKDICATCHRYNQLTIAEQEKQREGHDKHIQRYKDSLKAKQMDKD